MVKYYPDQKLTRVFIIQYCGPKNCVEVIILCKHQEEKMMRKEKVLETPVKGNFISGATYVCSDMYLYRGFGKLQLPDNKDKLYNTAIHRLRISPEIAEGWELVAEKSVAIKSDGKEEPNIPMEKKKYGYGVWEPQNKTILMMGGYVDTYNE